LLFGKRENVSYREEFKNLRRCRGRKRGKGGNRVTNNELSARERRRGWEA